MPPDTPPTDPPAGQEPPRSRRAGVVALALVGLVLTAGITYAASTVVSQPIGLTSEPATVGESLAPGGPVTTGPATTTSTSPSTTVTTVTQTVTTPPVTTTATPTTTSGGDDHGGGGDEDGDDD